MQKINRTILYSAADIVNFLECEHHTTEDLIDLQTSLPRSASNEELRLIQSGGRPMKADTPES
ncbi:MAG: hypothetical protein K9K79_01635 [Desulfohalobiaceae bacterium]|nr:hypothetical protein [Desulfohalobiaceae bacterium]